VRAIWKYTLKFTEVQDLDLPLGAELLTVQAQHGQIVLWAIVDIDEDRKSKRTFVLATNGAPFLPGSWLHRERYLGTFQLNAGSFVGHVFEQR
jgi:hypothetical protein